MRIRFLPLLWIQISRFNSVFVAQSVKQRICDGCEYWLLCSSLQCGSVLQGEDCAVVQNLLFDNAAVNFGCAKK